MFESDTFDERIEAVQNKDTRKSNAIAEMLLLPRAVSTGISTWLPVTNRN